MNVKKTKLLTTTGKEVIILSEYQEDIKKLLLKNRNISPDQERGFFAPTLADLHNPFLMPDMNSAVKRILEAIHNHERVVVFGDYDVDGVSSTAIVVRFLAEELHAKVSYRLPHRVHDGYGLKDYFFDELSQKGVSLVITVDCGTRDILPIAHAKKLGIDVLVTDHHAVPDIIPTEVIGIANPKRKDSEYPFSQLAGAGVAFKLIHAILLTLAKTDKNFEGKIDSILEKYIDFASLGTVSDCMPLIDENRIITTLGLRQMKNSESAGLRKFLENTSDIEGNAEIIGFQIGPRINAAGRMDTPLTALRWLLASESRSDEFYEQLEGLNNERKEVVQDFVQKALSAINPIDVILFFLDKKLEHGLIGLVAGRLTEQFNRPSIVLCEHHEGDGSISYVASCRAPEWCNLMELLDDSKELFLRYGGHRQAAGFSISPENFEKLQHKMKQKFFDMYGENIPHPSMNVEAKIDPKNVDIDLLDIIEKFKPFGIGNPRPLWLFEDVEITEVVMLGNEGKHRKIYIKQNPNLPLLYWNVPENFSLKIGDRVSFVVDFDKNIFNGKKYVQSFIKAVVLSD